MRKGEFMGRVLCIALVLVLIGATLGALPSVNNGFAFADQVVAFPDSSLEAAVREAINKPEGEIYQSDLEGLTELHASWRGISDLTGLEYCVDLTGLHLRYNEISDISPLSNLTNLNELNLDGNQISDVSQLSNLTNLSELNLGGNQISDISALSGLAELTHLALGWNHQISDISPLSNLTKLVRLDLAGNQISDMSPLSSFTNLESLCFYCNQISNVSPLSNLTNLNELNLGWNQISDISPLSNLNEVTRLELAWNSISDISPLSNLSNLTLLVLLCNRVSDISPLSNLVALTVLNLQENHIDDISPLSSLTNLTWLYLGGNPISDITPLSGLTEIRALYLDNNLITDVTPLVGLTKLGEVEDEWSLWERACKKVCLGLQNNQIIDISPLVENEVLAEKHGIDLRGNPFSEESLNTYIPQLHQRGVSILYLDAPRLQSPLKYAVINTTTPTLTWTQEDPHSAIRKNKVYIEQITGSDTAKAVGETVRPRYEFLIDATTSFNVPDGYLADGEKYEWRVGAFTDTEGACEEACSEPWYLNIDKTYEETTRAAIIVDEVIASDIEANLNQYIEDVESIYDIEILQYHGTWSDSIHLRAFIQGLYSDFDIDGVILVGDLPYALWEFPWGETCPLPFYYADMDGTFEDRDSSGMFDYYEPGLNEGPEIWVSWMRPDSDDVVSSLNDYLEKCHNYYCGNIHYQAKALVCIDKDWGGAVAQITADLLHLYPEVVSIGGPWVSVSPEEYVNEYVHWYEITDVWSHSSSSAHYFAGGRLPGSEIKSLSGGSKLTLIWGCHAGDFHESPIDNVAASYVFDNNFGLASIAATRSIGTEYHEAVIYSLSSGKILGDAVLDWLSFVYDKSVIKNRFPDPEIQVSQFMWDFILIGNPFIIFNNKPSQPINVSPPEGATGIGLAPNLNSAPFSDPDVGDTHLASQWQMTTSSGDYSSTVFDSGTDTYNLTSIAIPSGTLSYSTIYYWRVRHQDSRGAWSDWSWETSFITLEAVQYNLTITSAAHGSVTIPGEGTFTYDAGTVVDLVAEPHEGYQFINWTGDVDTIADVDDATTTITMNDDYEITANFERLFAGGSGTEDAPYQIANWRHLHNVRYFLDAYFILINDLDSTTLGYEELAGPDANEGKGWQPIGRGDEAFTGTFDGQGYEIRDLFINRPDEDRIGLLGYVGSGGLVQDTGVVNAGVTGGADVGGLVGRNWEGTVTTSYFSGNVSGDWAVGGLVGDIWWGAVSDSYSTASVTGSTLVGGLAGRNVWGTVSNSYSTGDVTGGDVVGGLVGDHWGGTVNNSYSSGSVTGASSVGGLVGGNVLGTVSNSHYNCDEVLINGEYIVTIGALFGEDFEEWLANDKSLDVNERLSQEDGYYVISDVSDFKELLAFGQDVSLKFRLKDDLDLADEPNFYVPYLGGGFDGNGHEISNLSFNFDFVSQVGLFGYLARGGEVTQLGVQNVSTTAFNGVGGLVGRSAGTVSHSYSTGTVTGEDGYVGGLVGNNVWGGAVRNSYSTATVEGVKEVGGLVGGNAWWATVSDSYATGSVAGDSSVGGLAGSIYWGSTVSNSYYSTGSVTGDELVGGLVGYNEEGTVSNSFWDVETSGMDVSAGGTGRTTAEMMNIATFTDTATVGLSDPWDMIDVPFGTTDPDYTWNMVDFQTYPFLSWEKIYLVAISTADLPDGQVGSAYQANLEAIGGTPPYTWEATGLPNGLTRSNDGVISGTPIGEVGEFTVTVTVSDAMSNTDSRELSLTVSCKLGDANMDGVVNAGDLTKVRRIYFELDPPTPCADVNGDGVVDAGDLTAIRMIYFGLTED